MAGHSKWAQIKRGKAITDAARSRVFSRFAREITMESKKVGGNPSSPTLANIITRAKAANMPKENIERAVTKGVSKDAEAVEQVAYELYGPGAVAIIVTALTDNRNRTTQAVKIVLSKLPYDLGAPGSASWAFTKTPDGKYIPNEPMMDIGETDEDALQKLLEQFDELDDTQALFTNARGYESTDEQDT
jgi:YebC/PmpR family DNA-binding regulatory protein